MAIDFPTPSTIGETYTFGGRTWVWNGTGWAGAYGSGASGGSTKVTVDNFSLGTQGATQTDFTYSTVTNVAARGLVSLLVVTADGVGNFDLVVRGAGNNSGTTFLQVVGYTGAVYTITAPFYYENDSGNQSFFVGVRNAYGVSRTFTLTSLRIERFA